MSWASFTASDIRREAIQRPHQRNCLGVPLLHRSLAWRLVGQDADRRTGQLEVEQDRESGLGRSAKCGEARIEIQLCHSLEPGIVGPVELARIESGGDQLVVETPKARVWPNRRERVRHEQTTEAYRSATGGCRDGGQQNRSDRDTVSGRDLKSGERRGLSRRQRTFHPAKFRRYESGHAVGIVERIPEIKCVHRSWRFGSVRIALQVE